MDLNSVMWILAAARAAGERRPLLGGEVVRSLVAKENDSRLEGESPRTAAVLRRQPRAKGAGSRLEGEGSGTATALRRQPMARGPGAQVQVQAAGAGLEATGAQRASFISKSASVEV